MHFAAEKICHTLCAREYDSVPYVVLIMIFEAKMLTSKATYSGKFLRFKSISGYKAQAVAAA